MSFENLLATDERLSQKMRVAEQPGLLRTISAFFAHSGDSWFCAAVLIAVWFLGAPEWQSRASMLLIAVIITAVLVMALKFTIRRRRPEGEWGNIYRSTDPHSFPSGHATRAFMLATMALGLGPAWFGLALVIWAPLVALGRVAMGVHYLSDILAGIVIGVLMGLVLQAVLA